ncbi:MAG: tetratricopeptide repeat protein, partial [Phycisphaerae bacterium]|nr:tetratricopeptide repeat protein [Phycisphaerae bacterium]
IPSAIAVLGLLVVVVFSVRYWRGGVVGVIWFLATIAVTLPLVPSRNVLAAERYTYLPAIGFHWIIATACVFAFAALRRRGGTKIALPVGVGACVLACVVLLATAWKTTGYYEGNVARFRRTAELYPQYVEVWMRLAWAYYDAGQYEQAVKTADDALERYPESSRGDLWQVQGMALLRCGAVEQALAKLEAAVGIESDEGMAHVRLATALAECGRLREAVPHYRRAVELLPNYNPGIIGLAQAYRKLGQWEEAARAFDQALRNNPYDPTASSALAEFELSSGQVVSATGRLERLLDWMPEHAVAHANLGVCYSRLGRHREAERECRRALALDATLVPPRLALAMRLARCGVMQEAGFHFGMAAEQSGYADIEVLLPYSDFLIAQADLPAAAALWAKGLEQRPNDPTMAGWYAWVCVLAERWELAWRVGEAASQVEDRGVGAALAGIMLDVHADRPERAAAAVGGLCADNSPGGNQAHDRLQQALKAYSSRHANNPWPYYLMIIMFDAQGRADAARLALEAFEQVCTDPQWIRRARSLRANATSQPTKNGGRMEEMENEK